MTNKERQKGIYKGILGQYPLGNSKAKNPAKKRLKGIEENTLYKRLYNAFQRVKNAFHWFIKVMGTNGYYKGIYPLGPNGYYSPPFKGEYPLPFLYLIAGSARAK